LVHGDGKPDNIRLVDDSTAVLIDLGFAHRPGENESFLKQGYILGTLNYLAPELCATAPGGGVRPPRGEDGVRTSPSRRHSAMAVSLTFSAITGSSSIRIRAWGVDWLTAATGFPR